MIHDNIGQTTRTKDVLKRLCDCLLKSLHCAEMSLTSEFQYIHRCLDDEIFLTKQLTFLSAASADVGLPAYPCLWLPCVDRLLFQGGGRQPGCFRVWEVALPSYFAGGGGQSNLVAFSLVFFPRRKATWLRTPPPHTHTCTHTQNNMGQSNLGVINFQNCPRVPVKPNQPGLLYSNLLCGIVQGIAFW